MPKQVLITGAASGLGRELAILFKQDGYELHLWDLNYEALVDVMNMLGEMTHIYKVDLSDMEQINKARDLILKEHPEGVDVVVANAGLGGVNPGQQFSQIINRNILMVNTLGAMNTLTCFLPQMLKRKSGHLVAVSSLASLRGLPGGASYSASKAALNNFAESLGLDLRKENIHVTTILPGFLQTPMVDHDEFPTPFCVPVEKAAFKCFKAIKAKRTRYLFPLPMAILSFLNKLLPSGLYLRLVPLLAPSKSAEAKVF